MGEPQEIIPIDKSDLVGRVAQFFGEGYRLVQIGCSTLPEGYELNYSFDKDNRFVNLRVLAAPEEEIQSVSVIYPNAYLYENEIHDLFGVPIRNISVDFKGTLFRTAIQTPFSIGNVKFPEPPKPKAEAPAQQQTEKPAQQPEVPEGQKE